MTTLSESSNQIREHYRPFTRWHIPVMALVLLALAWGPITIIRLISPQASWRWLPLVALLVAVESIYTTNWLGQQKDVSRFAYRAAEVVVILFTLRLLTWALVGNWPTAEAWGLYLEQPWQLIDRWFAFYGIIALFVWERSISVADIFRRLPLSRSEIAAFAVEGPITYQGQRELVKPINRAALMQRYMRQWVLGGLLVGFCAVATSYDIRPLANGTINFRTIDRLGLQPEMLLALLLYFLGGLWLASQGRLAMMRSRWLIEGLQSDRRISKNWQRASFWLLAAIAGVAAFLPIGSTVAIARIINFLFLAGIIVGNILLVLALYLFTLPLRLLGFENEGGLEPQQLPQEWKPPAFSQEVSGSGGFFGPLLLIVMVVGTAVALYYFIKQRGWRGDFFSRLWRNLSSWWQRLWSDVQEGWELVRTAVQARLPTALNRADQANPWRFIRLNALSPREKIYYFYLSTLRRAGQRGVERDESDTPLEYLPELKESWPEVEIEIEALTAAFLEARYSPQEIDEEKVSLTKEDWQRIRKKLKEKSKDAKNDGDE